MPLQTTVSYYDDAVKRGQREFRSCVARGIYPYLPHLDDFLTDEQLASGQDLGLMQVPLSFIVGTRTGSRTASFARNFMPLLNAGSEFAYKWTSLCNAHMEEGIRDPIKVYEYTNRYYVEEGNKRVSVLKFFDAVTVPALVRRIYPPKNDSPESQLYYEFVAFHKRTGIITIEFSHLGSYRRLLQLLDREQDEVWSDDDRNALTATFARFQQAYEACGGGRLHGTPGDAMLTCLEIYGYGDVRSRSVTDLKDMLEKAWEEITLQQDAPPIDLKLDPQAEKGQSLLHRVLPLTGARTLRVAFLHDKSPEVSGWTRAHDLGREHVEHVFEDSLISHVYYNVMDTDPQAQLERAIADGSTVLFTTSPRLLPASLRVAVDHPEVTIFNCSLNTSHRYIRTYYARIYEAKFIAGAIAGALSGGEHVGYICDYPIYGQIAGINAFAQGVQMSNPVASVYLEWSTVGGVAEATKRLRERGIRLISCQDTAKLDKRGEHSFGLSLVTDEGQVLLASPVWQWGNYYERLLRGIRDKTLQSEYEESSRAVSYYWGMSAGVVEISCSEKLPVSTRRLATLLRNSISSGFFEPFRGPLYDQAGHLRSRDHELVPVEQIITMDYLNENVIGTIPAYDDLNAIGKSTVDIVGVELPGKK